MSGSSGSLVRRTTSASGLTSSTSLPRLDLPSSTAIPSPRSLFLAADALHSSSTSVPSPSPATSPSVIRRFSPRGLTSPRSSAGLLRTSASSSLATEGATFGNGNGGANGAGSGGGDGGVTASPPTLRSLLRASADYLTGSSSSVSTEASTAHPSADTTGRLGSPRTSPPVRRSASARVMTSSEPTLRRSAGLDGSTELDRSMDKDFARRLEVLSLQRCDRVDERRKKKLEAALPGCLILVGDGEVAPRQEATTATTATTGGTSSAGGAAAEGTPPASPRRPALAIPRLDLHGGTSLVALVRTGAVQVSASVFFAEFSTLQSSRLRLVRSDAADASGVVCLGDPPRAFCGAGLGLAAADAGVLPQLSEPAAEVESAASSDGEDELADATGEDGLGSLSSSTVSRPSSATRSSSPLAGDVYGTMGKSALVSSADIGEYAFDSDPETETETETETESGTESGSGDERA